MITYWTLYYVDEGVLASGLRMDSPTSLWRDLRSKGWDSAKLRDRPARLARVRLTEDGFIATLFASIGKARRAYADSLSTLARKP